MDNIHPKDSRDLVALADIQRDLEEMRESTRAFEKSMRAIDTILQDWEIPGMFMDPMAVLRKLILRVAVWKNPKYDALSNVGGHEMIEALCVEPAHVLRGTKKEIERKKRLQSISKDCHVLFDELGLNKTTAVYLSDLIYDDDVIEEKKMKNVTYIKAKLESVVEVLEGLEPTSKFAERKFDLIDFLRDLIKLHPQSVKKLFQN